MIISGLNVLFEGSKLLGTYDPEKEVFEFLTGVVSFPCEGIVTSETRIISRGTPEEADYLGWYYQTDVVIRIGTRTYAHATISDETAKRKFPAYRITDEHFRRLLDYRDFDGIKEYIFRTILEKRSKTINELLYRVPRFRIGVDSDDLKTIKTSQAPFSGCIIPRKYYGELFKLLQDAGLVNNQKCDHIRQKVKGAGGDSSIRQELIDKMVLYDHLIVIENIPDRVTYIPKEKVEASNEPSQLIEAISPAINEGLVKVEIDRHNYGSEDGALSRENLDDLQLYSQVLLPFYVARREDSYNLIGALKDFLKRLDMIIEDNTYKTYYYQPESLFESHFRTFSDLLSLYMFLVPLLRNSSSLKAPVTGVTRLLDAASLRLFEQNMASPLNYDDSYYRTYKIVLSNVDVFPVIRDIKDVLRVREDKRVIQFRGYLQSWQEKVQAGNLEDADALSQDVKRANRELKSLGKFRSIGAWTTYFSLPMIPVDLISGIPIGTLLTPIGIGVQIYSDIIEKRNKWLLLGR